MRRLTDGDDIALNEIINRWQDHLVSFLWHMTHNHFLARDLSQETFVRLYQNRHRYRPTAPFASYLFRIARNLLTNHARWVRRHPSESLQFLTDEGFDPSSASDKTPAEAMVYEETVRQVRTAIAELPPDLREALVLFTYQGLNYHQVADIQECSEKAVETRIYRARQQLKEKLASLALA